MNVVTPPQTPRGEILVKSFDDKLKMGTSRVVRACMGFNPSQHEPPCFHTFRELPAKRLFPDTP